MSLADWYAAQERQLQARAQTLHGEIERLSARVTRTTGDLQARRGVTAAPRANLRPTEDLQGAVLASVQAIARLRQQYIALLEQAHEHHRRAAALGHLETMT
jgi:hypothetical protein